MQTATWFMACDTRSGGRHTLSLLLREKPGGVLFGHISNHRFVKERICMSLQRWEDVCDLGPPTTWATVGSCLLSVRKEFLTVRINLRNGQASSFTVCCLRSEGAGLQQRCWYPVRHTNMKMTSPPQQQPLHGSRCKPQKLPWRASILINSTWATTGPSPTSCSLSGLWVPYPNRYPFCTEHGVSPATTPNTPLFHHSSVPIEPDCWW